MPIPDSDEEFLIGLAKSVLGNASVAATTADHLTLKGIDAGRVDRSLPGYSHAREIGGFVFKKIEADNETPDHFGLFVRRKTT